MEWISENLAIDINLAPRHAAGIEFLFIWSVLPDPFGKQFLPEIVQQK
jgi:hypothetical protein